MKMISVLALALLASCQFHSLNAVRLPCWDAAQAQSRVDEPRPPVVPRDGVAIQDYAIELVPFAVLNGTTWDNGSIHRHAWRRAVELMADCVTVQNHGVDGGTGSFTVNTSVGVGLPTGPGIPRFAVTVTMFRAPVASLPFRFDESGMIRQRIDADACSGVLEGDTIVAVAGAPIVRGAIDSPHYSAMLALRVGASVSVDVIRPGSGKIAASVRCVENAATFRSAPNRYRADYGTVYLVTDRETGAKSWRVKPPPTDDGL